MKSSEPGDPQGLGDKSVTRTVSSKSCVNRSYPGQDITAALGRIRRLVPIADERICNSGKLNHHAHVPKVVVEKFVLVNYIPVNLTRSLIKIHTDTHKRSTVYCHHNNERIE